MALPRSLLPVAHALARTDIDGVHAGGAMAPRGRLTRPAADTPPAHRATALLYLHPVASDWGFPLILRPSHMRAHAGQVALPGGRPEPGETPWDTARREAHEEIDLPPAAVQRIGALTPVWIPVTHLWLEVEVGWGPAVPFTPEPAEVEDLTVVTLAQVRDEASVSRATRRTREGTVEVPAFRWQGWTVWGATAIALAEFRARLLAPPVKDA